MRNFNYLMMLTALVGFAAFTACERNANPETSQSSAVKFTGGVNDMSKTRAADQTWAADDAIGIFMVRDVEGTTTVVEGATNRQYTTPGDGTFTPIITTGDGAVNNTIYYPMDGNDVNFIAYYPYNAAATLDNGVPIEIVANQNPGGIPVVEVQPTFDLLYAKIDGRSKSNVNVPFAFDHMLSKLVINTYNGTGVTAEELEGMTIAIKGMNNRQTFNLSTGEFVGPQSSMPDNVEINPRIITDGLQYDAIILPTASTTGITVEFTIPAYGTFTWNVSTNIAAFSSKTAHSVNVTLNRTGITVTGTTINPWTGGDDISIDAE